MAKAKKKKKKTKKTVMTKRKARGIKGKSGLTVCQTWLKLFETKSIKTAAQCTEMMHKEFPNRASAIFNFPNTVIGRANKGLLDGKKHDFQKYTS
jgi:hypothetical protein